MKKNMMKDKCIRLGALVLSFAVYAVPAASSIVLMRAEPAIAAEALGTFDTDENNTGSSVEDVLVGIGAGQEKTAGSTGQAASDSGQDSGQDYGQSYSQGAVQSYSQGAVQPSGGSSSGTVAGDTAKEDDSDGSWKLMLVNAHGMWPAHCPNAFDDAAKQNAKLYVPRGQVFNYKRRMEWRDFKNVQEY